MAENFDIGNVLAPKTRTNPTAAKQNVKIETVSDDKTALIDQGKNSVGRRRTDGKVNLSFAVSKEVRKALKAHALDREEAVQQVLEDALELLFAKRDIKP